VIEELVEVGGFELAVEEVEEVELIVRVLLELFGAVELVEELVGVGGFELVVEEVDEVEALVLVVRELVEPL
jgi:hypothetical protein